MSAGFHTMYGVFIRAALVVVGAVLILGSSCSSEHLTLDLDEYGQVDRGDFLEEIDPLIGRLVFVKGRIAVNQISYPEASHFPGNSHAEVFPCTNNPFRTPPDKYPTRERIQAGLVPVPWFFAAKFVDYDSGLVRSVDTERSYESRHPLESIEASVLHDKCVTMLAEITGERDIASVFLAGTLYIHSVYDTEASLGR